MLNTQNTKNTKFVKIDKTDERFLDLLLFMLKKIDLTPENMAVMISSEITHIEAEFETMEIRFYFKNNPEIFEARINQFAQSSNLIN
ncbi:hypothetical protein K7G92_001001 [Pasteurella canis]|uniref:hypothetical protein n=1 Tax=Pasteurella canis TaxID=753 RepID=UPI001D102D32|nr:hypothetical protein [Pasteurella canis]UDW84868.1 hypothetical protein K7G91_000263 [Pasteurella canis]UEA17945.1 hypothetical protein K7G92_001001 [Pasteurella canis]GJJ80772.1 hypothetical protein PcPA57_14920 [Pasteurella canis]